MKNLSQKIIPLLQQGFCTPLISQLAKKTNEASATLHYNIKKLEETKAILGYKAVFNPAKIEQGFSAFVLFKLTPDNYGNPEKVGRTVASFANVESVDIITGDYEMIAKVRVKDQDAYYEFVKKVSSIIGVTKTFTLVSFRELKTEYMQLTQ